VGPVLAVVSPWLPVVPPWFPVVPPWLPVVPPWFPVVPGEPLPVGLTSVLRVEGKLDVAGEDVGEGGLAGLELPDVGGDVETLGLAV
jgi:hypothetical protein